MFFSFTLVSSWEIRNGSTNWKYTEKITFSLWHSAYIFTSYFFTVVYFSWCDAVHWSRDQSAPPWHLVTSSDVLLTSDTVRGPHLAPAHPDLGDLGCLRLLLLLVELLDGLDLLLELHPPEIRITISLRTQESVHYREEGLPVSLRVSISCQKIYDRRRMFLICWCQPLPCVLAGCCTGLALSVPIIIYVTTWPGLSSIYNVSILQASNLFLVFSSYFLGMGGERILP